MSDPWDEPPEQPADMSADFTISTIPFGTSTETKDSQFRQIIEDIRSPKWKENVAAIHEAYTRGAASAVPKEIRGEMETLEEAQVRAGKEAAASLKLQLPGFLFSGTFSERNAKALLKHSGLICADLDGLGNTTASIKEQISSDPHVLGVFVSPTGTGLKVIFRCDPEKPHKETFAALEHYVAETFGLAIDQACSDVSRICYASHDPEAFIAEDAAVLPYPPPAPEKTFTPKAHAPGSEISPGDDFNQRGIESMSALLESHGWTHSHGCYWRRPGKSTGLSASLGYVAPGILRVFSSSPETGLPGDKKGYEPFAVYTHLVHNGNWHNATRALGESGYGSQTRKPSKSRQEFTLERVAGPAVPPPELSDLDKRRVRYASPPPEPVTRLFLAGKPIATPGNLVTLISRAKTGKTATLGAAVAAILGAHYDRHDIDTFKFSAPHTDEAVVLIDTEQSPYDAWTCHQRTMQRAGEPGDPEWLHHYALVGYTAAQLKAALQPILDKAKANHGGIFTIILDGVADFVASVNDEAECNDFIAYLRTIAVSFNCPIICVIHSNEAVKSGDDGRGHLGKQLTRKAESNLLLRKVNDITTITSEKQRKAPITADDGVAFRWSEDAQRHVTCEAEDVPKKAKGGRPQQFSFAQIEEHIPRTADKAVTKETILRFVKEDPGIPDSTLRRMLAEATESKWVIRTAKGHGFTYHRP